jgi:hypothetical protein
VSNFGFLLGAQVLLATALWSGVAGADRAHAVEPAATRSARTNLIVAQTFHKRPGIPGSSDSDDVGDLGTSPDGSHAPPGVPGASDSGDVGGPVDGSHAPPPVPNFSDSGSASGGSRAAPAVSDGAGSSHAAPGLPSFGDDAGNAAAQSHAPPPAPNRAGGSHAAPGVPMMGVNP